MVKEELISGGWLWLDRQETLSTNDDALLWSKKADGRQKAVFTAVRQSCGRGRRGRNWAGLGGNLFMSQAIPLELRYLGQMVMMSSLALLNTIKCLNNDNKVKLELKWPNDILINERKVSGMLLEKGCGDYMIIGIGVNIAAAPAIERPVYPATSLYEAGIKTDRLAFLRKYLEIWDKTVNIWQQQGFENIRREWLNNVKGLNEEISVTMDNIIKKGKFSGVDDNGALLLEQQGVMTKIMAGDVFYMKENK